MPTPCPICSSADIIPLLSLKRQPVYQHPVSETEQIKPPYFRDLEFYFCRECRHTFQDNIDRDLLERIYRDYYYTPRPPDVGAQFQDEFIEVLSTRFNLLQSGRIFLEIGCSSGEVMKKLAAVSPGSTIFGFEPNRNTAKKALEFGFDVQMDFFTPGSARQLSLRADTIYHRHVIEHIADFDAFFSAHQQAAGSRSDLVIETPCLDRVLSESGIAPFHIEHLHVFSIRSLSRLMESYDWFMKDVTVTSGANMILLFRREPPGIQTPDIDPDDLTKPAGWLSRTRGFITRAGKGKKIAVWGAGSGGIKVINYFDLKPDAIVDGNPGKQGLKFVGFEYLDIAWSEPWVKQELENSGSWLVIVASIYFGEIKASLHAAGWRGDIISPYGLS